MGGTAISGQLLTTTLSADNAFLEGMKLREQGRIEESELIFGAIIGSQADALILLEIAKIYFEEKKYERSLQLFTLIKLKFALPVSVRKNISKLENEMKLRTGVFSYEWKMIKTKNPNKKSKSGTYTIFGTPLTYENDQNKNYFGINHSFGLNKKISDSWSLHSSIFINDFETSDVDTQMVFLSLDKDLKKYPVFLGISSSFEKGVGYKQYIYGTKIGYKANLNKSIISPTFGHYKIKNSISKFHAGSKQNLSNSFINPIGIINSTSKIDFQNSKLSDDIYSNNNLSFYFQKNFPFPTMTITPSIKIEKTKFKSFDTFWSQKRSDVIAKPAIELCSHFLLKLINMPLCFSMANEKRRSNISFYNYSENTFSISGKSAF